ncbi:MAG: hypothetical protein WDM86_08940 [Rhizomicrobium sp.]
MGAKIAAAAVLAVIGLLLVVFGVGFLSYALALALTPLLGAAGGAAVTGAIFVGPPVLWAGIVLMRGPSRPKPKPSAPSSLWMALFAAIAKETPWIAIVGAIVIAGAEMFFGSRTRK